MNSTLPLILIVDDLAANRQTLAELLDHQSYRLAEAADGPAALRAAAANPPDLILLDVMMPGMDGFEVCRRLRADARLTEVPVIMVTALDDQASRLAGIEAGADDFVSKPFNRAELRARVRTITRLDRYRRLLEAQASLQASEVRFRTLAEQSEEVFWFADLRPERTTYVSPAIEKIWGRPAADFVRDPRLWEQAIHPEEQARVHTAYESLIAGQLGRFVEEYRVVRPDGVERWVRDSGTAIRNDAGAVVSIGGVAQDITERKAAEAFTLRTQRLENLGMLAAGIAHDFNNALAPLVMGCPLLRPHLHHSNALHLLDTLEASTHRSVALVRQLLAFARGAGDRPQLLQSRPVLRELGDLAEATFPKSIAVHVCLPGNLWPIQANPTQIHQIFLNLCVNARDAMPHGGQLTVTAANCALDYDAAAAIPDARPGDFLRVEVRDTGAGISPEVLPQIWEAFYTTKGEINGTGLGLSTVRGILHKHAGFVTVQTQVGHGTTFTIYLPAATGAAEAEARLHPVPPARGANELILIVDDDEPVRRLAADILNCHGYRTLTAADGAAAIALYAPRQEEISLVLADQQMPLLAGTDLALALHRLEPALPIVIMSGASDLSNCPPPECELPFLAKPFQTGTLLAIIHQALTPIAEVAAPEGNLAQPGNPPIDRNNLRLLQNA